MYTSLVVTLLLFSQCGTDELEPDRHTLIMTINQNQTTWTAGENFPENVTFDTLKLLNGAIGIYPDPNRPMETKNYKIKKSSIPATFDAREEWSHCKDVIGNIRNQGQCGSCWSFAASEGFSDRLCIKSKGKHKFEFSPEDLLQCCKECVPPKQDTCSGGYLGMAWEYWVNHGVVSGADLGVDVGCKPYSSSAFYYSRGPSICKEVCVASYTTMYREDKHYGGSAYRINRNVEQIQTEIMTNGPVTTIYEVYDDFYNYKSGVYQHVKGRYSGNHAVKIIGWGTENGVPYWLVANSWGKEWGDLGGFFKILRGKNHCLIEQYVVAGKSSARNYISLPIFVTLMVVSIFLVNDVNVKS